MSTDTPQKTVTKKSSTTTVVSAPATAATARPARPTVASLSKELSELRESIKDRPASPSLTKKFEQLDAILKGVGSDEGNEYLVTLHERKLAGVAQALESLGNEIARIDALERNQTSLGERQNRIVGRLRTQEVQSRSYEFPILSLIVGLAVGVVTALLYWGHDWRSPIPGVNNPETGLPETYSDFRNDALYTYLWGAIAFVAVVVIWVVITALIHRYNVRKDKAEGQRTVTQDPDYFVAEQAPAIPRPDEAVTVQYPVAPAAPTEPVQAQGAPVSAR